MHSKVGSKTIFDPWFPLMLLANNWVSCSFSAVEGLDIFFVKLTALL